MNKQAYMQGYLSTPTEAHYVMTPALNTAIQKTAWSLLPPEDPLELPEGFTPPKKNWREREQERALLMKYMADNYPQKRWRWRDINSILQKRENLWLAEKIKEWEQQKSAETPLPEASPEIQKTAASEEVPQVLAHKQAYMQGYLSKEGYFGTSSWDMAKRSTRSKGSDVFDGAHKGLDTSNALRRTPSYITKLRDQESKHRQERQRFVPNTMVRTPYGVMGVTNRKKGVAPLNKQTGGERLKPVVQSTINDRAGSRWEITPRADQIAMYGKTDTGHTSPGLDRVRKNLGLSDNERALTPDQRKALFSLSNTGQTRGGIKDTLKSRGIQEVNPVAKHTLLTADQKNAVRSLYNKNPNDPRIQSLMTRHGLEAYEGGQQAKAKQQLDVQKASDRARNVETHAAIAKINRYVSQKDVGTLVADYKRLRGKAEKAYKAGRISKDDPRVKQLAYLGRAIRAKAVAQQKQFNLGRAIRAKAVAQQEQFKRKTHDIA